MTGCQTPDARGSAGSATQSLHPSSRRRSLEALWRAGTQGRGWGVPTPPVRTPQDPPPPPWTPAFAGETGLGRIPPIGGASLSPATAPTYAIPAGRTPRPPYPLQQAPGPWHLPTAHPATGIWPPATGIRSPASGTQGRATLAGLSSVGCTPSPLDSGLRRRDGVRSRPLIGTAGVPPAMPPSHAIPRYNAATQLLHLQQAPGHWSPAPGHWHPKLPNRAPEIA